MKHIYLIQSLENSYYKIGTSIHPQKRLREIQTGNPSPVKLIDTYPSEFANKIERTLHRRYAHVKKEGEWFDLSISIEISFKDECQQVEKNLILLKKSGNIFI